MELVWRHYKEIFEKASFYMSYFQDFRGVATFITLVATLVTALKARQRLFSGDGFIIRC